MPPGFSDANPKMRNLPRLRLFLQLGFSAFFAGAIVVLGTILYLTPRLPEVEQLRDAHLQIPLKIYTADGYLMGEFGEQRRSPLSYDDLPEELILAFLAAEDDNFFSHGGVDLLGLLRAASQIVTSGSIQSGGSTITMQVARNFFLSNERSFIRKFNEILLSLMIERELEKEEIFELYANKIYLGKRAYGVEAAANIYYGISASDLTLAQIAMIAGLPKAPSAYNPINNPPRAIERRNWILGRMHLLGYIGTEEYESAKQQPITATDHGPTTEIDAPYVAEMVRDEMIDRFGVRAYEDGYEVHTTVRFDLQKIADQALRSGLLLYDDRHGYRGPEQNIQRENLQDLDQIVARLRTIADVGGLKPAYVEEVLEQSLGLITKDGERIVLGWDQGLSRVNPYINENAVAGRIDSADQAFEVGDIIRLQLDESDVWHISQIPAAQATLVALDPSNGAILALSGGFDYYHNKFNRAIQARRQPGSNIKPFLYATALERGYTAASVINDAPIVFEDAALEDFWRPENDSGEFYGPTRLREALYFSRNLVSIRLLRSVGLEVARQGIKRFGFEDSELATNLTLALGSQAVPPIKIASGYASFANGGYKIEPYLIDRITDTNGKVVFYADPPTVCIDCDQLNADPKDISRSGMQANVLPDNQGELIEVIRSTENESPKPSNEILGEDHLTGESADMEKSMEAVDAQLPRPFTAAEQILDPRIAYIVDSMLKDVIRLGTGRRALELNRSDIAGKTGTTNGPRDAWFTGYTPDIVASAWVGFDNNTPLGRKEFGGTAALPIWIEFMRDALENIPENVPPQPNGIVSASVNRDTGLRTTAADPDAIFELFLRENSPPANADSPGQNGGSSAAPVTRDLF